MRVTFAKAPILFGFAALTIGLISIETLGQSATLFSPLKYGPGQRENCISFVQKTFVEKTLPSDPCDVAYGRLWAGPELDWFNSSTAMDNRSVIKDLGAYKWSDKFSVPVVAALPKLKPGEARTVSVNASAGRVIANAPLPKGAKVAAGANGTVGQNPKRSTAGAGSASTPQPIELGEPSRIAVPGPKPGDKPRVDPILLKAVLGHMYVIHVVDDDRDFYALFRVDELVRGDRCVISWKLIDPP